MLEKYYKILGVTAQSSPDEIRRNYRKLVMRYHPDKNPSQHAAQKFLLIKEAYEVVTGKIPVPVNKPPRKPVHRSPRPTAGTVKTQQQKKATEAERVKAARDRFKEQRMREEHENEQYYRQLTTGKRWKLLRFTAIVGFVIGACMIVDRFLPRHYDEDRVASYVLNKASSFDGKPLSVVKTDAEQYFWVSNMNYVLYSKAPSIFIERTWLFHEPVRLIARDKIRYEYFPVHFTHYRHFFALLLFFLPSCVMWYKRQTILFTMLFLSSYYGVTALLLYYLIAEDRWAHLLTLGFL